MEISEAMVKHYLGYMTVSYFAKNNVAPDDIVDYYDSIIQMKLAATEHGDLEPLRLAFDYLLTHADVQIDNFDGGYYPYDEGEVKNIILYTRSVVWPDAPPPNPDEVKDIKFIPMMTSDWWDMRIAQGLHPLNQKGN